MRATAAGAGTTKCEFAERNSGEKNPVKRDWRFEETN